VDYSHDIYRIAWRYIDSGDLVIDGVSLAANHGLVADDPFIDEKLNKLFPQLHFAVEFYDRDLEQWVEEKAEHHQ
jgi:phage tail protein X